MAQHQGEVAWFDGPKGYGFIKWDGGPDVFCHYSAIQKDGYKKLSEEDLVEFDIVLDNKGKQQAANVVVLTSRAKEQA